jgi:hypothetical protein
MSESMSDWLHAMAAAGKMPPYDYQPDPATGDHGGWTKETFAAWMDNGGRKLYRTKLHELDPSYDVNCPPPS